VNERLLARVLAQPEVRPEAVVRGRELLGSTRWCRADEVAAELVACLVERRLP
jgi:hypothetical protein